MIADNLSLSILREIVHSSPLLPPPSSASPPFSLFSTIPASFPPPSVNPPNIPEFNPFLLNFTSFPPTSPPPPSSPFSPPSILPPPSSSLLPHIERFYEKTSGIQQKLDPSSREGTELKNLLLSESQIWSTLYSLLQSDHDFLSQASSPSLLPFISLFRSSSSPTSSLPPPPFFFSDLSLLNSIISLSPSLLSLHSLLPHLSTLLKKKTLSPPSSFVPPSSSFLPPSSLPPPSSIDFSGFPDSQPHPDDHKSLYLEIWNIIRVSGLAAAQDRLVERGRGVFAGTLNGGLGWHDFGAERGEEEEEEDGEEEEKEEGRRREEERRKNEEIWVNKEKERRNGGGNEGRRRFIEEERERVLDFMDCLEWREMKRERETFYLGEEGVFTESCGNRNWLYSLHNFWRLSNQANTKSERVIFGYMSSNPEILLEYCENFMDRLWTHLRVYLNHECIRQYLGLFHRYRDFLGNFCCFDESFLDFEKEGPEELYNKIFMDSHFSLKTLTSVDNAFGTINEDKEIDLFHNKIFYLIIKCKILMIERGNDEVWSELFDYMLLQTSYLKRKFAERENRLLASYINFYCNLALVLRKLGFYGSTDLQKIDRLLLEQVNLSKNLTPPRDILALISFLADEKEKLNQAVNYLLTNEKIKSLMKNESGSLKLMLEQEFTVEKAGEIIKQLFFEAEVEDKYESLQILFLDDRKKSEALGLALDLIRKLMKQREPEIVKRINDEFFKKINFSCFPSKKEGELLYSELSSYMLLIDAFNSIKVCLETHRQSSQKADNTFKNKIKDSINKIRNAIFGLQRNNGRYLVFDFELLEKVKHIEILREICGVWMEKFLEFMNEIFFLEEDESEFSEFFIDFVNLDHLWRDILPKQPVAQLLESTVKLILKSPSFISQMIQKTLVDTLFTDDSLYAI